MKRQLIVIACILCFCLPASSQSNAAEESVISAIRTEFTAINAAVKKYRIDSSEVEGLSTEGGSIKKFYDGTQLRKAVLKLYGETGELVCEYYFQKGKVIFCYEVNSSYDKHVNEGNPKVISTIEDRLYFKDHTLIRWLKDKKLVERSAYANREKEILNDLKEDLKLL